MGIRAWGWDVGSHREWVLGHGDGMHKGIGDGY